MKTYFAALINKSTASENSKLARKMIRCLKKSLKISKLSPHFKEHNAFIFLAINDSITKPLDEDVVEETEFKAREKLKEHYLNHKSNLQKQLETRQELKETAKVVRDFLEEMDSGLPGTFNTKLKEAMSDLPNKLYELQKQSAVALWDLPEEQKVRVLLPGWTYPILNLSEVTESLDLEPLVDKAVLFNFFWIFMQPTMSRLRQMFSLLQQLETELQGMHYRTNNPKTQSKLEMLFKILSAKLSALQTIDKSLSSIFELFTGSRTLYGEKGLVPASDTLKTSFRQMQWKINEGKTLLLELREKIENSQEKLREYFDDTTNDVKTINSLKEFRLSLLTMAKLSSDLFIQAESLKLWSDFFGADVPYFTYQNKLFNEQNQSNEEASSDSIVSVRGLTKNYNLGQTTVYAIRGIDLDVEEGEFLAIVGNSGAGKTTLLNCIAGLDEPDHGIILFKGKNLNRMSDREKSKTRLTEMGFIFQSYALLPHYNARENIALPADLAGFSHDLKTRIEELLESVGISKQAKQYPAELSGGQMQRVAIARALTNRPKVLVADEPTGDLDSATGTQVMQLIKKFHEETKTTIIVITHEQSVANYAERQIVLEDGIIIKNQERA